MTYRYHAKQLLRKNHVSKYKFSTGSSRSGCPGLMGIVFEYGFIQVLGGVVENRSGSPTVTGVARLLLFCFAGRICKCKANPSICASCHMCSHIHIFVGSYQHTRRSMVEYAYE